jgi:hypothetical protein
MITINKMRYEQSELLSAWRRGNDAGEGYAVGSDDDTPREAAESELLEDIQEITSDGVVACVDGHKIVVIADSNGAWAVPIKDLD